MDFPIIKFNQNSHHLISTVLPFEIIDLFSHVLVYGKDEGGYQREPDPKHYNSIKSYVLENAQSPVFIFPTAIILGIDEVNARKIITGDHSISLNPHVSSKLFRIIDGQHRIRGIREALEFNGDLKNLQLNVVILITPPNSRSLEMQIFSTINSKSKRIKVDLIQLASFEYRILESKIEPSEVNDQIAIQVANLLNDDQTSGNKWHNAIKFGIHAEQKVGIIGVNAFRESIKSIVSRYLQIHKGYEKLEGSEMITFTRTASAEIKDFVQKAWAIVYDKWLDGFSSKNRDIDFDLEIKEYYYKTDYYIQKTLGTKAINYLLGKVVNDNENKIDENSLNLFKTYIEKSQIVTSDWKVGNTFSGYSSESAFNKVSKMVSNEIPVPRNLTQ